MVEDIDKREDIMNVDEMITLENGKSYGLLLDSVLSNNRYFLAVLLNKEEEPTNEFTVLKENIDNGKVFVTVENDPLILEKLIEDYNLQLEDEE